jgi:hypothetical protein
MPHGVSSAVMIGKFSASRACEPAGLCVNATCTSSIVPRDHVCATSSAPVERVIFAYNAQRKGVPRRELPRTACSPCSGGTASSHKKNAATFIESVQTFLTCHTR